MKCSVIVTKEVGGLLSTLPQCHNSPRYCALCSILLCVTSVGHAGMILSPIYIDTYSWDLPCFEEAISNMFKEESNAIISSSNI